MLLTDLYYEAKHRFADSLRRGNRTVLWTPDKGLGFGNFLYLWLHAYIEQQEGRDYRVRVTPGMWPWLEVFPGARDLVIPDDSIRFSDHREWSPKKLYQRFGEDFTRMELQSFIQKHILTSEIYNEMPPAWDAITVNVRRGDYYSVPEFRKQYGMDIPGYLAAALQRFGDSSKIKHIHVVSDDPHWCENHLHTLLSDYGVPNYSPRNPVNNLLSVSSTPHLVGTNSTFSYWGGYISNTLFGKASHVIVPEFHARHINDGVAEQIDPAWVRIHSIPGGWEEK